MLRRKFEVILIKFRFLMNYSRMSLYMYTFTLQYIRYHSIVRWISEKERKELKEKEDKYHQQKHDRKSKKVTIDFAGRRIIEDEPIINGRPRKN